MVKTLVKEENTEVSAPRHDFSVKLYPHQETAVEALGNGKILRGGTGVGKTITAVTYYWRKEAPRDVYVITTAKKRDDLDWEKDFIKYGVSTVREYSSAGLLTVISWNEIQKYVNVYGAFFIFDEQRLVGSGKWSKAFLKIAKRNRWILLTATPGDTWLDYINVFVANGFYANRTEFKQEHVVYNTYSKFPKVDRYVGVGKLIRLKAKLLVEMPYLRHTTRHGRNIIVGHNEELLARVVKDRWHVYENRPLRGIAELFLVMRKVVNSDPTRLAAVRELITIHPKLIVFYNFDFELEILKSLSFPQFDKKSGMTTTGINFPQKRKPSGRLLTDPLNSLTGDLPRIKTNLRKDSSDKMTADRREFSTYQVLKSGQEQIQTPVSTEYWGVEPIVFENKDLYTASVAIPTSPSPNSLKESSTSTTSTPTSGSTFQVAEWNGHKHESIPETDSWVYLVQYAAGAEGWNCIKTNATVFYSLTYSYKSFEQAHGRIDRINTPYTDLYYYTLMSNSVIDRAIRQALNEKRNFNETSYIRPKKGLYA